MDIDNGFLNSLLVAKRDVLTMAFRRVPTEMVQGIERQAYLFLKRYYKQSRVLPSKNALQKKFPDLVLETPEDTLLYYCDELLIRRQYETLTVGTSDMQNHLYAKDVDKAIERLREVEQELGKIGMGDADSVRQTLAERMQQYAENKKNKGIIGLQTRIKAIDTRIGGIQDEYFVIAARFGTGKTFLALFLLGNILPQVEGPIMFVSNEMGKKKIAARLDSVLGKFNYSRYRKGLLSPDEEKRMARLAEIYKRHHEIYIVPGAGKSAEQISYEVMAVEPAVLFVDGLYLSNEGNGDTWKDTMAASHAYQRMSKEFDMPVIATTQMTENDETKYARAISEDADIVLKMMQSPAMKDQRLMQVSFLKVREEDSDLEVMLTWDFEAWKFEESKMEADASAEISYGGQ